jgi:hypothetical protein
MLHAFAQIHLDAASLSLPTHKAHHHAHDHVGDGYEWYIDRQRMDR